MLLGLVVSVGHLGRSARSHEQPAPPNSAGLSGISRSPSWPQTRRTRPRRTKELPSIRVTTGLVHLVVTVTDHHRNFITDLDQSDFKVLENGTPQDIRFFGRETDLPLRIGLLLDTSNSIRPRLQFEKEAAIDFLDQGDPPQQGPGVPDDLRQRAGSHPGLHRRLSLADRCHSQQRAGGGTALDDAIYRASEMLSNPPLPAGPDPEVRRVIVVISDGDDNLSDHALSDAIDASIRSETAVYAISTNTDWLAIDDATKPSKYHLDAGDKMLQKFADQTGGRAFFPYRIDDLAQSFLDIGTELRSQYFIAYAPTDPAFQGPIPPDRSSDRPQGPDRPHAQGLLRGRPGV